MMTTGSIKEDRWAESVRKREIILDCAATIASSGGYDAVKMRAVADSAGIAVGTLYRLYPSKAHVLVAILAREFERIGAERDWTATAGSSRLRVEHLSARLCREWQTRPALTAAVTRAFVSADGSASAEVDRAEAVIEHLIGLAIAGGEPNPRQHRIAAIVGNVWLASLITWVRHGTSADDIAVRLQRSIGLVIENAESRQA
ncbi:TetR/AcrR family transcriptional regulator [Mycolicibacterium arabiense]|jgi:AcrR family transcriptional regulator|nr:TetR family transcriptional regulator [Mycolicibacterium arabiense]MCV7372972.1 TetR/AcrR family transcriptional regulator [Mycolicibacterium arabiense]